MLVKTKKEFTKHDKGMATQRVERKRIDILRGLSSSSNPQRGDYSMCRRLDKTLADYKKFKSDKDRRKITAEYYGIQKEARG